MGGSRPILLIWLCGAGLVWFLAFMIPGAILFSRNSKDLNDLVDTQCTVTGVDATISGNNNNNNLNYCAVWDVSYTLPGYPGIINSTVNQFDLAVGCALQYTPNDAKQYAQDRHPIGSVVPCWANRVRATFDQPSVVLPTALLCIAFIAPLVICLPLCLVVYFKGDDW